MLQKVSADWPETPNIDLPDWLDYLLVKLFIGNPKKIKAFNPDKTGKINCELTEDRVAAVFSFPKTNITSRVGISLDEHDACDNVNSESK